MLGIKSYDDVRIEPYRSQAEFHLTHIEIGWSCVRTMQIFNLDVNTEIDVAIYLNTSAGDPDTDVEILAFDTEEGDVYSFGIIDVADEWKIFQKKFTRYVNNAKVNFLL